MNKLSTLWAAGTVALLTALTSGAAFAAGPNPAQADHLAGRDTWVQSESAQPGAEFITMVPDGRGYRPVASVQQPVNASNASTVVVSHYGRGVVTRISAANEPATTSVAAN